MSAPAVHGGAEQARELYEAGLSLRQVAARLGVSHTKVQHDLLRAGVRLRQQHRRHLAVVPDRPPRRPPLLEVPPERAAVAFTADRGWHLVDAPPGWLLDVLAELE